MCSLCNNQTDRRPQNKRVHLAAAAVPPTSVSGFDLGDGSELRFEPLSDDCVSLQWTLCVRLRGDPPTAAPTRASLPFPPSLTVSNTNS